MPVLSENRADAERGPEPLRGAERRGVRPRPRPGREAGLERSFSIEDARLSWLRFRPRSTQGSA